MTTITRAASDHRPMSPARALVAMSRPSQIVLIWAIYLAGVLLGLTRTGAVFDAWAVVAVGLLVTGAAAAAHLVNEAEDAATDRRTVRTPFSGGSGALEASGLDPKVPLRSGLALAALVAALTWVAWLALPLSAMVVLLVLVGLVGALAYSLPPLAAMRHGWGEPLNAILGGMLLPLAGVAAVTSRIEGADLLAFLPFTLAVFASVMATAWPDRAADAATGKLTMQVRLRPTVLRRIHAALSVGFVMAALLAAALDVAPFALPLVVGTASYTRRDSPLPNVVAMVALALVLVAAHAMGLVGGWGV